jgi:hypothetical protein
MKKSLIKASSFNKHTKQVSTASTLSPLSENEPVATSTFQSKATARNSTS